MVLVHAGGENGCVPNVLLIFKSGFIKNCLNFENYKKWITEVIIPNLNKNNVIIIDKAYYHSAVSYTHLDVYKRQSKYCGGEL